MCVIEQFVFPSTKIRLFELLFCFDGKNEDQFKFSIKFVKLKGVLVVSNFYRVCALLCWMFWCRDAGSGLCYVDLGPQQRPGGGCPEEARRRGEEGWMD